MALDLVDDVLLNILYFCDISTIFVISQTSKRLYALAFSREVWLVLLSNLQARNFLYLRPHETLREFSFSALIDLVKSTVYGPPSWIDWNPTKTTSIPYPILITLHPTFPPGSGGFSGKDAVQLMPGGRFVLYTTVGISGLRCWSVVDDKLVWQYQPEDHLDWGPRDSVDYIFSAEVVDGGRVAMIAVGVTVRDATGHILRKFMEVLRLDFYQGISHLITRYDLPQFLTGHLLATRISGDFAMVRLRTSHTGSEDKLYLLQLSTQSRHCLTMPRHVQVELIPDHIILVEYGKSISSRYFRVWRAEAWMSLSVIQDRIIDLKAPLLSLDIPPLSKYEPAFPGGIDISAHASPLREGQYHVWVLMTGSYTQVIQRYDLSLLDPKLLLGRYISQPETQPIPGYYFGSKFSYSGHAVVSSKHHSSHTIVPIPPPYMKLVPGTWRKTRETKLTTHILSLPNNRRDAPAHISAYSGVLTFRSENNIVIEYYT